MAVIDLREKDIKSRNTSNILSALGQSANIALRNQQLQMVKDREQQRELEKQRESMLTKILYKGQIEGWTAQQMHDEIIKIPEYEQSGLFQRYALGGFSGKKVKDPYTEFKYWSDEERKTIDALPKEVNADTDRNVQFIREQKRKAMFAINPELQKSYDTDYYQQTTKPEERLKHKISYAETEPEKAAESYREAILKKKGTEKDIEDLKKIFKSGNTKLIMEAIKRIGIY